MGEAIFNKSFYLNLLYIFTEKSGLYCRLKVDKRSASEEISVSLRLGENSDHIDNFEVRCSFTSIYILTTNNCNDAIWKLKIELNQV